MRIAPSATLLFLMSSVVVPSLRAQSVDARGVEPEAVFGLSLQPDAVRDVGRGGYHFTLFPVGPDAGVSIRRRLRGGSSLGVRIEAAFFLLGEMDITTIQTPVDKPASLGLLFAAVEWRSVDRTPLPVSIGVGLTRAVLAPRSGARTTPTVELGVFHRLTKHTDARLALNVLTDPIGRSWFQLPLGVSVHPERLSR